MINRKKLVYKVISVITVIATFSACSFSLHAQNDSKENNESGIKEYISLSDNYKDASKMISLSLDNSKKLNKNESVNFNLNIPSDSAYNIEICFKPENKSTKNIEYSLKIDNQFPFSEAKELRADCIYENDGDVVTLSNGDQVPPELKHIDSIMKCDAYDVSGLELQPYKFNLTAGNHIITLTSLNDEFNIYGINLKVPDVLISYSDYINKYDNSSDYSGDPIIIEAEKADYKNAFSVSMMSDTGSPDVTPNNNGAACLNNIGGKMWSEPGQELSWVLDIKKAGKYKIATCFKQDTIINGCVYRSFKIDGKIPFEQASRLSFNYSTSWTDDTFKDEKGNDLLFYLPEGKHTISLCVTLGNVSYVFRELKDIVTSIGNLYMDMVMIAGESPDSNRDYELHKQIPEFKEKLEKNKNDIDVLSDEIKNKYKVNGELDGALKNMSRVLNEMSSNLYSSQLYIKSYFSYYQTLSAWLYDIKNMSLSLDKIICYAPEQKNYIQKAWFGKKIVFSLKRFITSFSTDYNVIDENKENKEELKLWVNWGRDQVKVLNSLIRNSFTAKTGVNVKVEQVNATIVQGIISNNSPDIYLELSRTEPVNLAMRGVLYNLKNFDDYKEVLSRFKKDSEIPYIYKDGLYGLPNTQLFNVMFYRTDILEKLGIDVPTTWEEYLDATAVLQRKNMNTYLPYVRITTATTVNSGIGGLNIYPTMLMQSGGNLYNSDLTGCNLGDEISVKIMKFWSDFYVKYGLNPDINFYQRFRVGTVPLGITAYNQCLTFSATAPEIKGKWGISVLPGFINEDGSINNVCSGAGTGCVILKSSKYKKQAWEFLKWWTSSETQYEYSSNVESIIGETGRIASANVDAVSKLSWDKEFLDVILSQWNNVEEIREVPGSYYVSRSVDQAFWAVYNKTSSYKEAITSWGKVANEEIKRKELEYANKKY